MGYAIIAPVIFLYITYRPYLLSFSEFGISDIYILPTASTEYWRDRIFTARVYVRIYFISKRQMSGSK